MEKNFDPHKPRLLNVNEDPFFSGKIKIGLINEKTTFGKKGDIILNTEGIFDIHAIFYSESNGEKVYLEPGDVNKLVSYLKIHIVLLKNKHGVNITNFIN